jgi:hypothetical protein
MTQSGHVGGVFKLLPKLALTRLPMFHEISFTGCASRTGKGCALAKNEKESAAQRGDFVLSSLNYTAR